MGISQTSTCDCCQAVMPDSGILNAMTTMSYLRSEDGNTGEVFQYYYGEACGCAPRVRHAIGLELNKHDQYHNPVEPPAAPVTPEPTPAPTEPEPPAEPAP